MSIFIDTSVVLTAWGGAHPSRAACRQVISRGATEALHTSVECAQEVIFHRLRTVGRATALTDGANLSKAFVLHPFDLEVYERSLDLLRTTTLRGRDAVIAATAIGAGFTRIVSLDRGFDSVPGLTRVDPPTGADPDPAHPRRAAGDRLV